MSFNGFIHKYNLKKIAILSSLSLGDVRIYLRDGPLNIDIGIVKLLTFQGTRWKLYINECYFGTYGITPANKLSKFIMKRNGNCLFSE